MHPGNDIKGKFGQFTRSNGCGVSIIPVLF